MRFSPKGGPLPLTAVFQRFFFIARIANRQDAPKRITVEIVATAIWFPMNAPAVVPASRNATNGRWHGQVSSASSARSAPAGACAERLDHSHFAAWFSIAYPAQQDSCETSLVKV